MQTGLKTELEKLSREELLEFYKVYSQKFAQNADIQWRITALFVPLSMGGIVVWDKGSTATIFVGLFSILLIWIWYLLERRNGRDLRTNHKVTSTIESLLSEQSFEEFGSGLSLPVPSHGSRIRYTILFGVICYSVSIAWLAVIIYSALASPG